jgi:hypothetical protein
MRINKWLLSIFFILCAILARADTKPKYRDLDARKIEELAAVLPKNPRGLGPDCNQREKWQTPEIQRRIIPILAEANRLLAQPFPAWNQEAYLAFSRTGSTTEGEKMMYARQTRLAPLVLAECVQGQGKYIRAIEQTLTELIEQPTWELPAIDRELGAFKGDFEVGLNTATIGSSVAQSIYLLKHTLSPQLTNRTTAALRQRMFLPVERSLRNGNKHSWLRSKNNWNPVCLAGVVSAALAVLPDLHERAVFVAAGKQYVSNYIDSLASDGYAVEGPVYWNYGLHHYVLLREVLNMSTQGKIDLFAASNTLQKQRNYALYGSRMPMFPNNVAAFGDGDPIFYSEEVLKPYLNEAWELNQTERFASAGLPYRIEDVLIILFNRPKRVGAAIKKSSASSSTTNSLGHYFSDVGVLVSRGKPMAITIKGGGSKSLSGGVGANHRGVGANGGHSHNDIGSYAIAIDSDQPTGDVGKTVYSSKTFSKDRYTIKAINSYGHPVPVVAGQTQQNAHSLPYIKVSAVKQTPTQDKILIDLRPAYKVNGLKVLTRQMSHNRAMANKAAQIDIEDRFVYNTPQDFETALTTLGSWQQESADTLILKGKNKSVRVKITSSAQWKLKSEKISEEGLTFVRIGIALKKPSSKGFIRMTFTAL